MAYFDWSLYQSLGGKGECVLETRPKHRPD